MCLLVESLKHTNNNKEKGPGTQLDLNCYVGVPQLFFLTFLKSVYPLGESAASSSAVKAQLSKMDSASLSLLKSRLASFCSAFQN